MKGLKEYIKKHGKHFTEELAYVAAFKKRWSRKQIENAIQKRVWYNVTNSTLGDIVFLVNDAHSCIYKSKRSCIKWSLVIVGDFNYYDGVVFDLWLKHNTEFDFTPYI